jgi:hypothetical protein
LRTRQWLLEQRWWCAARLVLWKLRGEKRSVAQRVATGEAVTVMQERAAGGGLSLPRCALA